MIYDKLHFLGQWKTYNIRILHRCTMITLVSKGSCKVRTEMTNDWLGCTLAILLLNLQQNFAMIPSCGDLVIAQHQETIQYQPSLTWLDLTWPRACHSQWTMECRPQTIQLCIVLPPPTVPDPHCPHFLLQISFSGFTIQYNMWLV